MLDSLEIVPSEPDPDRGPVRAWQDGTPPIADSLQVVREDIDSTDHDLVSDLYNRKNLAIGATVFKATRGEVIAPERQAAVIENAVANAKEIAPDDTDFHDLIRSIWEVMLPKLVAMQAEAFNQTTSIEPR
jgi:chorismate mutase